MQNKSGIPNGIFVTWNGLDPLINGIRNIHDFGAKLNKGRHGNTTTWAYLKYCMIQWGKYNYLVNTPHATLSQPNTQSQSHNGTICCCLPFPYTWAKTLEVKLLLLSFHLWFWVQCDSGLLDKAKLSMCGGQPGKWLRTLRWWHSFRE